MWEVTLANWSQIVIAAGVIITAVITLFRFFVLKPLVKLIDDRTKQIQPDANGGKSLTDLHHRIDNIESRFDNIETSHKEILEAVTRPARKSKATQGPTL